MNNRYIVLVASLLIQISLGGLYAWSEFIPHLKSEYDISTTETQLIFGITIASFTIAMIFAGRLQDKKGPKLVAIIGGVLFGLGYIIAAFSGGSFILLLLGIGFIAGSGIGFGYVAPLATCIKWFPNHQGLITGISVAGFGGGAVVLAELVEFAFNSKILVLDIFLCIGILYGATIIASAFYLSNPKTSVAKSAKKTIDIKKLIKNNKFKAMLIGMSTGTFAGLLVIGNLKPLGDANGLCSDITTAAIAVFAIGNALGRLLWGKLYDKLKEKTIPISLIFIAISVGMLLLFGNTNSSFIIISLLIGMGFGGCFVIYATSVSDIYGISVLGSVYPWIFLSYGASGILGPLTGGILFDITGSYLVPVFLATLISAMGAVFAYKLYQK